MGVKVLNQRQIFSSKRAYLESKVLQVFNDSQDSAVLIEQVVAILVKNTLVVGDYSLFLYDLIRELFLSTEDNDTMRKFLPFFQHYFSKNEWNGIINRLFKSKTDFFQNSKVVRESYKQMMKPPMKRELLDEEKKQKVNIESIFEDGNGKRHKWILRDVDPLKRKEDFQPILEILTMLSIFETDGVRKFSRLIKSKRVFSEEEELVQEQPKAKKTKMKKVPGKNDSRKAAQKPTVQFNKTNDFQTNKAEQSADRDPKSLDKKGFKKITTATVSEATELEKNSYEKSGSQTEKIDSISFGKGGIVLDTENESRDLQNNTMDLEDLSKVKTSTTKKNALLLSMREVEDSNTNKKTQKSGDLTSQSMNDQLSTVPQNLFKKILQSIMK